MNPRVLQPFTAEPGESPVATARRVCNAAGHYDFATELRDHLDAGFVYALPKLFVMARAVLLEDSRTAWHVTHAAGDLRALLSVMPFPLDWIAFERRTDGRLRVYRTARLMELGRINLKARKPESGAAPGDRVTNVPEPRPHLASPLNDPRNPELGASRRNPQEMAGGGADTAAASLSGFLVSKFNSV